MKHQAILDACQLETSETTGSTLSVTTPLDGSEVAQVPMHSVAQAEAANTKGAKAFKAWRKVPAPRRGELVRLLGEELRREKENLGRLVTLECGKIYQERLGEVQEMIDICDFAVGLSRQLYGLTIASERPGHSMRETWHPIGICGIITAFNFPAAPWCWNAALALVCGDPVIAKPSEKTPLAQLEIQKVCDGAMAAFGDDAPDGLIQSLIGERDLGEVLTASPDVAIVSATGSVPMGKAVAADMSKRFGKTILELGGNNAMTVVLKSAEADILGLGSDVRKNNTGPDWKQNYIGTCSWFGVVTEAIINLEPVVREQAAAIVVPRNDAAMLTLLQHLEARVVGLLSAFEFMSRPAMAHSFAHVPSLSNPFAGGEIPETAVLVELSRSCAGAPWDTALDDVLQAVLTEAWELPSEPIADALFGRPEEIWALRHALSEGVKSVGPLIAFDLGFTREKAIAFRTEMTARLANAYPQIEICDFGHLGDGELHFNLIKMDGPNTSAFENEMRDYVVGIAVEEFGGLYSAEHGIGPKKHRIS